MHGFSTTNSVLLIFAIFCASLALSASVQAEGRQLAFDPAKGNCLACHAIASSEVAGNIGPPLVAMLVRFPDKAKLRAQIADASALNPNTLMPPFARHGILSGEELDKIVEFIYTL
jgi:L-cysteine S-thiosulfotransferase